jgi:hypothetical protein
VRVPEPGDSDPWLITSPTSLLIDRFFVFLDGAAVVIALAVVLSDIVRRKPVNGLALLLVVGIPLIFFGQLWVIVVSIARGPQSAGRRLSERLGLTGNQPSQMSRLFAGLPRFAVVGVFAAFGLGWLSAITAFSSATNGSPATPGTSHCAWPVSNHGVTTCVTHVAYLQAGAALQRFAAGILMGFFVIHFGVLLSETRRRSGGPQGLDSPPS